MDQKSEAPPAAGIELVEIAADVVAAYLSRNHVPAADLPSLLADVHAAFAGLGQIPPSAEPAVNKPTTGQIRRSIKPDALISFEDGKPYKTLKRHIAKFGFSPEEYRAKWGLPRDYPMTAASYSEQRSKNALSHGFGRRPSKAAPKLALVPETIAELIEPGGETMSSNKRAARRKPRVVAAK